jgi:photosystem II stability/assembly factor-like uncharacterized protein
MTAESAVTAQSAVVSEFSSDTPQGRMPGAGRAGGGRVANTAAARVSTTRWRVLSTGKVEREAPGAGLWQPAVLQQDWVVTAGSAPTMAVCWLVGKRGLVLLSDDAEHFSRVPFPETIDLVAIRATSPLQAVVTAADGRVFVTSDGGTTWRSGLQETPASSF